MAIRPVPLTVLRILDTPLKQQKGIVRRDIVIS